jgi:2-oxoglutarate ferredoxin oxidoreductase subunit alpha
VILLPASVSECFEFGWKALDLADHIQTPVIILSDWDLGMNLWMSDSFTYPDVPVDRGKILWEQDMDEFKKKYSKEFARYMDVDRDGIPYRTVPGNMHPDAAFFTRGTGHDEKSRYSEDAATWEAKLHRIKEKILRSIDLIPDSILESNNPSKFGVISYGSTHFPLIEAVEKCAEEGNVMDYLRIRGLPCDGKVANYLEHHEKIFVVENNRDGQMANILNMTYPKFAQKIVKISKCDGMSLSAEWIYNQLNNYKSM